MEHRFARLVQLGIRRSDFFGRRKTKFQLLMASAVANLTLTWSAPAREARKQARNAAAGVLLRSATTLRMPRAAIGGRWGRRRLPRPRAEFVAAPA